MTDPYFKGDTLDDVLRDVFEAIVTTGDRIAPSKGDALELRGALLEIANPRARLSRTETRGKPFSCLGELCWYLAGSDALDFIAYYIPDYDKYADGDSIFGAYGPRLFHRNDTNQVHRAIGILKRKPDSRQAVIQIFEATDLQEPHNDVPCTCTLQFLLRDGKLDMFTSMRSNDAYVGMPHDIFAFTMLQEIVARSLSVELGAYRHAVGSLHIYLDDIDGSRQYLKEGWQSSISMPPMPVADPWDALARVLESEATLRLAMPLEVSAELDSYWKDLIRLLRIFRHFKDGDAASIAECRDQMDSNVYSSFIDQKLADLQRRPRPATEGL